MGFLLDKCTFQVLNETTLKECTPFTCGNNDLDEFFSKECCLYSKQLLGKSYCFRLDSDPSIIVCAFTLSNDSIKVNMLPNARKGLVSKHIPREKQMRRYPAVLIGRLGVNSDFQSMHIGTELMDFIKVWFVDPLNKTGCRFIVVDAYNEKTPLSYYSRNDFKFLFSTEEQEGKNTGIPEGEKLKTRLMYFDLIQLCIKDKAE